jgi:hypothetical protein
MGKQSDHGDGQLPWIAWTQPTAADKVIGAHLEQKSDRLLIDYLRSDNEITLNLRWYLADVLEQLAEPKRGAPKKSISQKYRDLAKNDRDVAAVLANEIVRRWREGGRTNHAPDGTPINFAACAEALDVLRGRFPGYFKQEPSHIELRMRPLRDFQFARLWDELNSHRPPRRKKVQNKSAD